MGASPPVSPAAANVTSNPSCLSSSRRGKNMR
jgi:hypothetical protein